MYLIDSSVWVSLFLENDSNHREAVSIFNGLKGLILLPYSVLNEVCTVLVYKHSKRQSDLFLEFLEGNVDILRVNNDWDVDIKAFRSIDEKISFTDMSVIQMAISSNLALVTFDLQMKRVYRKLVGKK
jgi:predicted nucleic acid-binding protein